MKELLFKKDFSQAVADDEDIRYLLNLHTSISCLSSRPKEEQIIFNRSLLKAMFIAEELHGCFSLENNNGIISFSVSEI